MASASFLFSTPSIPISREKTNPTISSRIRCCEDTLGNPNLKLIDASNGKGMDRFPEKRSIASVGSCPRPRRIILVRHGQSEGNVDESVYTMVPDPKIRLTQKGWDEAEGCGKMIRDMIQSDGVDDWKVYFYVSPYARTLETLRGLGRAFDRDRIAGVREEPRLREQDFGCMNVKSTIQIMQPVGDRAYFERDTCQMILAFQLVAIKWMTKKGNFQDREKMRREKVLRNRYGRFFYRFPDGESAADVYDRITGFRETLRADIDIGRFQPPGKRTENMNLVIVSHGLTLRVFLMRWYKWTVEQFEGLNNFGNGGMLVMELGDGGRYSLLVHHTEEELRRFGLTDEMLTDQKWYTVEALSRLLSCP